ncbi:odorant receptor Or2 [Galleria mellonella]|uniref:Odorant receptor n=2 Tax=Galleria mellonella TaxID=7137 RepID=A0A6J3CAH1_GALME|nr:odorant receptor Or2 [Galleria mellonella]
MSSSNQLVCTKGLLRFLEDPRYPSVGPHLRLLEFTGLWHPNNTKLTKFKQCFFYITIAFFFSQYVKCCISMEVDSLMLILKYAPFHMGIVKSCFFRKSYKKWETLIDFISSREQKQLAKNDEEYDGILNEYINRSRRVSYFFWGLAFFSNFSIFSEPYQNNQIIENGTSIYYYIFDGYTPFSNEPPGYYVSMAIQTILGLIVSAYVVGWDTLVVTMMIFFAGQLRISRLNCVKIIDRSSKIKSHENIGTCHSLYTDLIKYQKIFNSLISPAMFIYLIVISVNLGVCIIQIAQIEDDLGTLISSCVFVVACLIQLLLFYWHANEVTEESKLVSYGIFESDWVCSDKRLQKEVALLGVTTTKILVFKAGLFNVMSLSTFIAILRASYSFYTLLSETN